jgi:hypothetical protein
VRKWKAERSELWAIGKRRRDTAIWPVLAEERALPGAPDRVRQHPAEPQHNPFRGIIPVMPDRQIPRTLPRVITHPDHAAHHNRLIADKLAHRLFLARLQNDHKTWLAYARQELTSALEAARLGAATSPEPSSISTTVIARDIIRAISSGTHSPLWQEQARIIIATMLESVGRTE